MENNLHDFLCRLVDEEEKTRDKFPKNLIHELYWAIPFFGDIDSAKVLTVGVNPAAGEFELSRGWENVLNQEDWLERLRNYFGNESANRHEWFEPWEISLGLLGFSYEEGTAAHLDVSPRPTPPMIYGTVDRPEFREMIEHDVKWFFELLEIQRNAKLLLVCGPVISKEHRLEQLGDFIREFSAKHGWTWKEGNPRSTLCQQKTERSYEVFLSPYVRQEEKEDGFKYCLIRNIWRNLEILKAAAEEV